MSCFSRHTSEGESSVVLQHDTTDDNTSKTHPKLCCFVDFYSSCHLQSFLEMPCLVPCQILCHRSFSLWGGMKAKHGHPSSIGLRQCRTRDTPIYLSQYYSWSNKHTYNIVSVAKCVPTVAMCWKRSASHTRCSRHMGAPRAWCSLGAHLACNSGHVSRLTWPQGLTWLVTLKINGKSIWE